MYTVSKCSLELIDKAASSLLSGAIVAFPTETVYGLGVDAENKDAVARMYSIKARPSDHPVIVHISNINDVDYWANETETNNNCFVFSLVFPCSNADLGK